MELLHKRLWNLFVFPVNIKLFSVNVEHRLILATKTFPSFESHKITTSPKEFCLTSACLC